MMLGSQGKAVCVATRQVDLTKEALGDPPGYEVAVPGNENTEVQWMPA